MKKVLVAGAALLIVGSMVSAASAEVSLSGDARVRYVGTSDYVRNISVNPNGTLNEDKNGYADNWNSRIRVKFHAKANGGAFMKARLRLDDVKWGTEGSENEGWSMWKNGKNVWADYAFIGVPMGPVTFTGGVQEASYSKFFEYDQRPGRAKLEYKTDNLRLIGLIDMIDENATSVQDQFDDNDLMAYGFVAAFQINDDWSIKGYARYRDDQMDWDSEDSVRYVSADSNDPGNATAGFIAVTDTTRTPHVDTSGFLGSIHAQGKVAMVGLEGELAYKEADVQGTQDDGWGWYVNASMDMGAFIPSVMIGGTYDGYQADDDFGFIMIGAAEPITVIREVGTEAGDSFFAALMANYAVSDQFKLAANLVYYDIDINEDSEEGIPDVRGAVDAWEISGSATYVISEGADLSYKLGYLDPSYDGRVNSAGISDDGYFGQYLRMQIKF